MHPTKGKVLLSYLKVKMEKLCIARVLLLRNNNIVQCIWSHWNSGFSCWLVDFSAECPSCYAKWRLNHTGTGLNLPFSLFPQPCPLCHLYDPTPAESYSSPCHLLQSEPLPNWTTPNGPSYSPDFVPFSIEHNSARAQSEMICCMKMDLWAQSCLPSVISTQH